MVYLQERIQLSQGKRNAIRAYDRKHKQNVTKSAQFGNGCINIHVINNHLMYAVPFNDDDNKGGLSFDQLPSYD